MQLDNPAMTCPAHQRVMYDIMIDAIMHRYQFVIFNIAQQVGKSSVCSQYFPAWFLGRFPRKRVLLISYEASFAAKWGGKVRDILERHGQEVFGITIDPASSAKDHWDIVGGDGGMDTAGILGPVAGKPADHIIIEDLIKTPVDATPLLLDNIKERYDTVIKGRIRPETSVVIPCTRITGDDLPGHLIKTEGTTDNGGKWKVFRVPALAEADDPLGRALGEPLWPEARPLEWWLERRDGTPNFPGGVSARTWAALYQQDPLPQEGSIYKDGWWNTPYEGDIQAMADACSFRALSLDTASKTGVSNDYTAFTVGGAA
jgi:hypothetical protein